MPASAKLLALDPEPAPPRRGGPRLDAEDMRAFAAIARERGIRNAAQALGQPRSTLSRRLTQLERALGGRLVARSTRQFVLTDLGESLMQKCLQLEELLVSTEEVASRASREPAGTLSVAASPIVGEDFLPEVIAEYLRRFPKMQLRVDLSVDFVDLRRREFDLAIRTGPLPETTEVFAVKLGVSMKGLYASKAYLRRKEAPRVPTDLAGHDCILVGADHRQSAWAFRERGSETHLAVSGPLRVSSYRLARSAAADGVGIVRLPHTFARPLVEDGSLIPLLKAYWPRNELFAVHTAGRPAPPKIRAFIELVRGALRRQLPDP